MRMLKEFLVLVTSFGILFLWQYMAQNSLAYIAAASLVLIVITLLLISARKYRYNVLTVITTHSLWSEFFFTTSIMLVVLVTGGITSLVFFLVYFLSFSVAFVYELPLIIAYVIGIILLFFPEATTVDLFTNVSRLGLLIIILPVAYYFGRDYRNYTKKSHRSKEVEKQS